MSAAGRIDELNREGDVNPSTWKDGVVTTTPGFRQAFQQFGEGVKMPRNGATKAAVEL